MSCLNSGGLGALSEGRASVGTTDHTLLLNRSDILTFKLLFCGYKALNRISELSLGSGVVFGVEV